MCNTICQGNIRQNFSSSFYQQHHTEYHVVKQDKDSYKLYEGQHEAIIDRETWFRVQAQQHHTCSHRRPGISAMLTPYVHAPCYELSHA